MKIIVGGAGNVGKSIVRYLNQGNNDIIVIDTDQQKLDELSKEYDVQPVLGSVSHPDILEMIGADKADMIIAATDIDEVNLVACQVAYSLFNIPKKIARVDSKYFLNPLWNTLYNEKNLPVDLVISPDIEIAKAILRIIKIPGTCEVIPLANNKLHLLSFKCNDSCPFLHHKISNIIKISKDLEISIVALARNGNTFMPKPNETIQNNDEVYFLTETAKMNNAIAAFGLEHNHNEKIVIFGGNAISYYIAKQLEEDNNVLSCHILEENENAAKKMAQLLENTVVLQGEMMSDFMLEEANINKADIAIAVTSKDKDNLLASLLSQMSGAASTLSLVNSRSFDNLVDNINSNVIIDRSSITISNILQELRKAHLHDAHSLGRGFGEIWEIKIAEDNLNSGKSIKELNLPEKCRIDAIYRNEKIIYPSEDEKIEVGDLLIVFVASQAIKRAERIFE